MAVHARTRDGERRAYRLADGLVPLAAGYEVWLDEQHAAIGGLPVALRDAETGQQWDDEDGLEIIYEVDA
jgi:hypothetical protein